MLLDLINQCVEQKRGNKEFALFRLDDGDWRAEIGNPTTCVMLGEASGEFRGEGKTPEDAVMRLLHNIKADSPAD